MMRSIVLAELEIFNIILSDTIVIDRPIEPQPTLPKVWRRNTPSLHGHVFWCEDREQGEKGRTEYRMCPYEVGEELYGVTGDICSIVASRVVVDSITATQDECGVWVWLYTLRAVRS